MQRVVRDVALGFVATVNDDGTPPTRSRVTTRPPPSGRVQIMWPSASSRRVTSMPGIPTGRSTNTSSS